MQISPSASYPIKLLVNHFSVRLNNADAVIFHYEIAIAIAPDKKAQGRAFQVYKSDSLSVKRQLFKTDPTRFPSQSTAYDGDKNIFSTVRLPTGLFRVTTRQDFDVTVTLQAEFSLNAIASPNVSRNVLHALDVILREKPSAGLIVSGRGFYWADRGQDLRMGVQALDGFIQGLRVTEQGLVVYVDYSAMAFCKNMPIIDVIQDTLRLRQLDENVTLSGKQRTQTEGALRGLPVTVNHRVTPQKFTVQGLGAHDSDGTRFTVDEPEGRSFSVREYFLSEYGRKIKYGKLPCLDLGKNGRSNYVPMEFCEIAGGQRFPKQNLNKYEAKELKGIAMADPSRRKDSILHTVRSDNGPCVGELLSQCGISIERSMTQVTGKVLQRPELTPARTRSVGAPVSRVGRSSISAIPRLTESLTSRTSSASSAKTVSRSLCLLPSSYRPPRMIFPIPAVCSSTSSICGTCAAAADPDMPNDGSPVTRRWVQHAEVAVRHRVRGRHAVLPHPPRQQRRPEEAGPVPREPLVEDQREARGEQRGALPWGSHPRGPLQRAVHADRGRRQPPVPWV
ncbi:Protein argonaute 2 [Acorus calamus]|uniref:Protein argonaute 2 n=1 Tax=Acorus calamus TaxID=4465 RepID=A0AAV9CYC5_ACOCL|nr:Protein argonaute 2 [Acorus calamus]